MTPERMDCRGDMPFMLPHSHAPAPIMRMDRIKKGCGESANRAGNKTASKASAVMMRCLSIESAGQLGEGLDSMHDFKFKTLNGHDLLFFGGHQLIDFGNVLVCDFLHFCFGALLLVLRSQFVFDQLLD